MDTRTMETAVRFGILEKVQAFESELRTIQGVVDVEFDLDGFYDNMRQVIFLVKYDIPAAIEDYFQRRRELVANCLRIAADNDLTRTEDRIEDHGTWFYFVTRCGDTWKGDPNEQSTL